MGVIDAHVHLGLNEFCADETKRFKYDLENRFEEYVKYMEANGIDKAGVLPMPSGDYDSVLSNGYLIEAARAYPDKFIPFCRMDKFLWENIVFNGFCGAKFHMVYERHSAERLESYYKILEYYGAPLIVHAKFADKPKQIRDVLNIAPNLKVIVAHMGRGEIYTDNGVEEVLRAFEGDSNVYFETSTVGRKSIIERACGIVGSERIMFGTDYPFGVAWFKDMYSYYDEVSVVRNANIAHEDKENIFEGTAQSIFKAAAARKEGLIVKPVGDMGDMVWELLHKLDKTDINYLAINKKWDTVRRDLRNKRHVYILSDGDEIVGYFRESGRNNGFSMLEEIVIFPEYRGMGHSKRIMDFFVRFFPKSYAKTHSKNVAINGLLTKYGYVGDGGQRIINWTRG